MIRIAFFMCDYKWNNYVIMKSTLKAYYFLSLAIIAINLSSCSTIEPDYYITKLDFSIERPHQINILFHVYDDNGNGVPGLESEDFLITEDNKEIGLESDVKIKPTTEVQIKVKTVLLLDNSTSIDNELDKLKDAAIALIKQMPDYQEISIFVFSSNIDRLTNFTSDKDKLIKAIESIGIGSSSTNLFGALATIGYMDFWVQNFSIDSIRSSNLICFTDGDDTQGSVQLKTALNALNEKKVFMVGLGEDLNRNTLMQFGDFYPASNIRKLKNVFLGVQTSIENYARSFYWLYYQSPKRGNFDHTLRIGLKNNQNTSSSGTIEARFNSKYFSD